MLQCGSAVHALLRINDEQLCHKIRRIGGNLVPVRREELVTPRLDLSEHLGVVVACAGARASAGPRRGRAAVRGRDARRRRVGNRTAR